jgi:hypothetical protein
MDAERLQNEPRGETERTGGGYLSYKRAHNTTIQHDENMKRQRPRRNTHLPISLPPLAFTSLSAEECVAPPTDQTGEPRQL